MVIVWGAFIFVCGGCFAYVAVLKGSVLTQTLFNMLVGVQRSSHMVISLSLVLHRDGACLSV